ncbi:MAG: hypothetical protein E6I43_13480 [Chloroflexi bacterium]|nr:MAG: hypothetical protein E6I43_13480 [Chloroflexota bacterium]
MKNWAKQLAGAALVLVFALAVGGFVMVLRAQQGSLAATMAEAHIHAVSPPDGATNVPVSGEIRAEYVSRPANDPTIKLEPPVGVTLDNPHWDGTTFVIDYRGLRASSLYHVELDQDDWTGKGEHKQIKVRWSFHTGTEQHVAPSPSPNPTSATSASPSVRPSTSGPLIWYGGPSNDLHGVDWSGRPVKNLSAGPMIQSPDGLLLWRRPNTPGGNSAVYDANGDPVGFVPVDQNMMWADDGRTFCGMTSTPTASYELDMLRINAPRVRVGTVPVTPGTNQVPVLAACSVLTQRAVVIGQSNGQYIAEQFAGNTSGPATLIRQLPSGTTVGQFSGIVVQRFSWDGSLVVGNTFGDPSVQEAQVMRYRTHEIVWHQCMCPHPHWLTVLAQPNGSKVAVVASTDDGAHVSFNIVDANGTSKSVTIASTPITPAF